MPRKKQPKTTHFSPRLHRHPHYFLVLGSFLFLAAIASFLLVLSVLMQQTQDLRQQADEVLLPDLSISENLSDKSGYLLSEPVHIQVTVNNRGKAPVTTPFNVTIQAGLSPSSDGSSLGAGYSTSVPVTVPIPVGGSHKVMTTIPGGTLAPGSYALKSVPDPIAENAVIELFEDDLAYDSSHFTVMVTMPSGTPDTATAPASTPLPGAAINLYFTANHSLQFYKESTNESIKTTDIISGERYRVRHTARIQSDPKNPDSVDARSVIAQFRANDSGLTTKNFALSQVERAAGGIDLVFETTFTGSTNNSFVTTLDSGSAIAETNESDNTLTTTYTYQVVTTTTTTQKTYAGCNDTCSTNRDCSAGLACSSGRCRNPSAVSSTNCQVPAAGVGGTRKSAEQTNTTGAKGTAIGGPVTTAPSNSPTPRTQPTPRPSGTPLVTPTPTLAPEPIPSTLPEASMTPAPTPPTDLEGEVLAWLNQLLITLQLQLGLTSTINPLWIWLVIGGIALIIILLLVSLLRRKPHDSTLPVVPPPLTTATGPVTPPPTVRPITSAPMTTAPMTTAPTPQAPPVPPSSSSMVSKLQSRGVIKPSPTPPQPPVPPTE